MTDHELKEIESRRNAASWEPLIEDRDHQSGDSFIMTGVADGDNIWNENDIYLVGATDADLNFIAAARQDIPLLHWWNCKVEEATLAI